MAPLSKIAKTTGIEKPPNKAFQISAIERIFKRLNPEIDPSILDFESYVDSTLHIDENIENLEEIFPTFKWRKEVAG